MVHTAPPDLLRQIMRDWGTATGSQIADRRIAAGRTPTVFAGMIGVSTQTLHRYEHGQAVPSDAHKAAIALALDVELDELYRWPSNATLIAAVAA